MVSDLTTAAKLSKQWGVKRNTKISLLSRLIRWENVWHINKKEEL